MEDIINVCRLCMGKQHLVCIFKFDNGVRLDVKAMACAVIKIQEDDGLPLCICKNCESKLNDFYDFKIKCENTETKLKCLMETKSTVKSEIVFENGEAEVKNEFNIKTEVDTSDREYIINFDHDDSMCSEDLVPLSKKKSDQCCDKKLEICKDFFKDDRYKNILKIKKKRTSSSSKPVDSYEMLSNEIKPSVQKKCPKIFQCEACGRTYKTKFILKKHILTHTGERPFRCPLCPKQYTRNEHLVVHLRTHSGTKPFVCEACGRSFTKNQDLSRHRLIHSEEKRFQCTRCERTFKRSADVHSHMRTHTGKRPYICRNCNKSYTSHSGLRKHRNRCSVCISVKNL